MSSVPLLDSNAAMNMASEQDIQAQRRNIESLSKSQDSDAAKRAKLEEACEGFEAIFIQKMWEQMRASLPKDGLMSSSKEEQFWQGMYDQELAKSMASSGGIGLADMMMEQMSSNISSAGNASKIAPNRSKGLEISPAPLINIDMNSTINAKEPEKNLSQTQVKSEVPIAQALNSPIPASNLYEEEATQPIAPQIEENLGIASQNIDNKNSGINPSPANLATANVNNNVFVTENTTEQAPIITKVTYQTNLPPSERKAMLSAEQIANNFAAQNQAMQNQAIQNQTAQVVSQPNAATATQAMQRPVHQNQQNNTNTDESIKVSDTQRDILAGITTSYMPTKKDNTRMYGQSSVMYQSHLQATRAGGPHLVQPSPVQGTKELGMLNPEKGSMESPVEGKISSGFGWRLDPITGKRSWHNGVDIPATVNSPVKASEAGVVSFAGYDAELGNMIIIDHPNGLSTVYGHNGKNNAKVGDIVEKGTEIARVGSSGRAAGNHVHFEIRKADLPINPENVLNQGIQVYTAMLSR